MGMVEFVFKIKEKFVLNELSKAFHNRALERIRKKILQEAGVEYSEKLPSSLSEAIDDINNLARAERQFIKKYGEEAIKKLENTLLSLCS